MDILWRGRNGDALPPKIHWDGSRKRASRSLNQLCLMQKIIAAEKQKQIEVLTAGLQKVSAQLEVSKPAPQVTENDQ